MVAKRSFAPISDAPGGEPRPSPELIKAVAGSPRVPAKSAKAVLTKRSFAKWSRLFLAELAATSNVSAGARRAGVSTSQVYDARRANSAFARAWLVALCEGYDLLEMQLLQRMREGEIKPAATAKKGVRAYDNALALRL